MRPRPDTARPLLSLVAWWLACLFVAGGLGEGLAGEETVVVNGGTEEEAALLFDEFKDVNNVYGLVGTSAHVHYLGIQESSMACAFAAVEFYLHSGGSARMGSYVWHPTDFANAAWQGLCFGHSGGHDAWDPKLQKGVVTGRLRERRWRRWSDGLNSRQRSTLLASAAARAAEVAQSHQDALAGSAGDRHVEDGADAVRGCNVLEWRLVGTYMFGPQERFILSSRSCSICGWKGCNVCPPRQICRGGKTLHDYDAFGGREEDVRPGDVVVRYDQNHAKLAWADVVLFPATGDFERFQMPAVKPEVQAWVAVAGESSENWEHVETLKLDTRYPFDLVMGYSRELSHMHASYFPHNFSAIRAASTPEHRRRQMWPVDVIASINVTADAVLFVSNCESSLRNDWVQGLMDAMPVDSYGACFKNKQLPLELERQQRLGDRDSAFEAAPGAWRTAQGEQSVVKIQVMSRYKFGLAFENTRDPDYMTEKVFEVLEAGAVPVYLGAPNWREFLPWQSPPIIDAGDFDSPYELAQYLIALAADEERLAGFHKWRQEAMPDAVPGLEATSFTNNLCNVCQWKLARDAGNSTNQDRHESQDGAA